jgi:hypothetical protein
MPPKNKVTESVQPPRHRPTSSERRAAQLAAVSGHQADLKREAAERRAKREAAAASATSAPRNAPAARRRSAL